MCALVRQDERGAGRCPDLEQMHVQYCGAAPIAKLVPFSDSPGSPCAGEGFRYCDSYLMRARPHGSSAPAQSLLYAPNHLWLDVAESGLCHIGIDAFLAGAAGVVDRVTFVNSHGTHRPAVALTVNGVEWPMMFPNPMLIQSVNARVRSDPKVVTADPYGSGWLFEGWELPGKTRAGLISGPQAEAWQTEEREGLAHHVNDTQGLNGDGGYAVRGVAQLLGQQDVVRLFQQFFSRTTWAGEE
jgi:glycine cleavage system H lipoate-binding protein